MVLNIKNLFKKVCMLSAAATMAVGLGASFAGASAPDSDVEGTLLGNSGAITIGNKTFTIDVKYNPNLAYTGSPIAVLNSITLNGVENTDLSTVKGQLYLRVKNTATDATGDENDSGWKSSSDLTAITVKNKGTYSVYYTTDTDGITNHQISTTGNTLSAAASS